MYMIFSAVFDDGKERHESFFTTKADAFSEAERMWGEANPDETCFWDGNCGERMYFHDDMGTRIEAPWSVGYHWMDGAEGSAEWIFDNGCDGG